MKSTDTFTTLEDKRRQVLNIKRMIINVYTLPEFLNVKGLKQICRPIKTTTKIHLSLKNPFYHYLFSVHLAWFALRSL